MCTDLILQMAPDVEILPVRVFGRRLETSPDVFCAGLRCAIERGAHVVNVSLGTQRDAAIGPLYRACEDAKDAGVIVVAAGDNLNDWSYPAAFENVIGVASGDLAAPFDFHYRADDALECVAKGVLQRGRTLGGGWSIISGTSVAAPMITGIACQFLAREPGATLARVRELLARFALEQ